MLVFGHTGITLGATLAISSVFSRTRLSASRLNPLIRFLDLRFVLIGSLLPDIIDKPLGHLLFRETLSNGRIFSHTLLFSFIISLAGYLLYYRRRQIWLSALATGSLFHLVLDEMWFMPRTLLWPTFGFSFDKLTIDNLVSYWLYDLIIPKIYIPEILGLLVLTWFGLKLLRQKQATNFLRQGRAIPGAKLDTGR